MVPEAQAVIRFIHLGDQINEDADEFAFYNTVPDRFLTIAGVQTFDDRADLEHALKMALDSKEIDEDFANRLRQHADAHGFLLLD